MDKNLFLKIHDKVNKMEIINDRILGITSCERKRYLRFYKNEVSRYEKISHFLELLIFGCILTITISISDGFFNDLSSLFLQIKTNDEIIKDLELLIEKYDNNYSDFEELLSDKKILSELEISPEAIDLLLDTSKFNELESISDQKFKKVYNSYWKFFIVFLLALAFIMLYYYLKNCITKFECAINYLSEE